MPFLKKDTVVAYENFDDLKDYLGTDRIKKLLAINYCNVALERGEINEPAWIKEIIDHLNS